MSSPFKLIAKLAVVSLPLMVIFSGIAIAYTNGEYGTGTYGSCSYGEDCSISLTSDGNISLDITPATGGRCTIQSDDATVETDDSNGYTLTLSNNSTNTSLVSGGDSITATSGSFGSPTALSANVWGYRVDGVGGFGAGPTTSQANISPPALTFAEVVASNVVADTIVNSSSAANPAVTTTVWYGACADTTVNSGTYTTQALYTAVAN